ncbi:MAG: PEP-CTERM sorting domain-containing protein [Planctomycetota bacterium]
MFRTTKMVSCVAIGLMVASLSSDQLVAAEPNDDFLDATVLSPGTLMVSDSLEGGTGAPDTNLGFFADDTFTLPALEVDDDSSPLGNGLADALFDIPVNDDGSIPLAVTGCCDDFDGSHDEEGGYELLVDVFDAGGSLIDSFAAGGFLIPGIVDEFDFADPTWIGGTFDAVIDNTVGPVDGVDPLDFWVFTGLVPGSMYEAEITDGDFDSILAWFAPDGTPLDIDDDDGFDLLSKLLVEASPTGEVHLAVTGFDDFAVIGLHPEAGDYELTLTRVPEPATVISLLIAIGGVTCCLRVRD